MNGKEERCKGSAERPRKPAPRHTGGERLPQQPYRQQVKQPRVQGVEQEVCQMVARRIDPPQKIVKSESHPGEGDVMAHVRRGDVLVFSRPSTSSRFTKICSGPCIPPPGSAAAGGGARRPSGAAPACPT